MPWQLILDVTVAILLVAFIAYAVVLSRQLKELRKSRDDMEKIIKTFNEATSRAEAGIPRLRKTAEDAGQSLDERVSKARTLRDDLAYMVERADGMAARLEGAVRVARGEAKPSPKDSARGVEPKGTARGVEPKGIETRGVEPRGVDPRGVEPRGFETRGVEPRGLEPKGGETWSEATSEQDARLAAARPRPRARLDGGADRGVEGRGMDGRGPLGGTRPLGGLDGAGAPPAEAASEDDDFSVDDERSEAERALLRALQSAR